MPTVFQDSQWKIVHPTNLIMLKCSKCCRWNSYQSPHRPSDEKHSVTLHWRKFWNLRPIKGWITTREKDLEPYYRRKDELTIQDGCLLWGNRVITATKLRNHILSELHEGHLGIVKMKAIARSFIWWPNIDKEIEQLAEYKMSHLWDICSWS